MKEQYFCYTCGRSCASLTEPHECNPLSREEIVNAAKDFGGKALLSLLAAPGEHGKRDYDLLAEEYADLNPIPEVGQFREWNSIRSAHSAGMMFEGERCDVELLQARATIETLRHELKMGHSCALMLASSEARVRSLTAALEWYAKTAKNTVALKALREVQR